MTRAEQQVSQYLYQGESIREAFDVGPVRIVLTSHRVFASLPDDEGIQQAELPNVTGVSRTTRGSLSGVVWGISLALIGVAFLGVGVTVRVSDQFTTPEFREGAASEAGAGSLTELVGWVIWIVRNLDTLMLGGGALFVFIAALPVAHYWFRVRERTLAIELAGEQPDIHLPLEYISVEDEFRLEKALVPEQVSDDLDVDIDETTEPGEVDSPGETPGGTADETATDADETGEASPADTDDTVTDDETDEASPTDTDDTVTDDETDEEASESAEGDDDIDEGGFEWIGTDDAGEDRADSTPASDG